MAGSPAESEPSLRESVSDGEAASESDIGAGENGKAVDIRGKAKERDIMDRKRADHRMLPAEILENILYLIDPETFASLILVDRAWRQAAQTPQLFAYHLSRCPSFSFNHNVIDAGSFSDESLPHLKRKFAQEVKRNLFEAYLQPKRTAISLISTTTSSSASFPGGEAFDFVFSPNGHWTVALSSSRIYLIDTVSPKISVQRELKVLRRPISAAILNDGSLLAVLSSNQHVYVYSVTAYEVKHLRSISLENKPHAIALAVQGDVLAAAYESGVEIYSLASSSTDLERRIIKCERFDALSFSHDSSILMGTTRNSKSPVTVILTAPYLTDETLELPAADRIAHMWTNQIVFPNTTRDCSHATLLPNRADGDASWIFTYDRVFESFRAVRTDDLRNGTTYFTGPKRTPRGDSRPSRRKLIPCTMPAATQNGDLVAAGFSGKDVWLYGVPEGLDSPAINQSDDMDGGSTGPSTPVPGASTPVRSLSKGDASELKKLPKWQVLVDKYRNTFAKGRRIAEIPGVSAISWVSRGESRTEPHSLQERLIIAAPGGILGDPDLQQDDFAAVDGGRLIILDFDRTPYDGTIESLTFEVGHAEPEILKEESRDLETEVALARRRTVRKESLDRRTVVGVLASAQDMFPMSLTANAANHAQMLGSTSNGASSNSINNSQIRETAAAPISEEEEGEGGEREMTLQEATNAFEGPYSHTQPRSRDTIYRSATAVAANRERNPRRIMSEDRVEFRRPDGRGELPHESDADNWVPPPPPYAPKAEIPLPEHLQRTLLPKQNTIARPPVGRQRLRRASTAFESPNSRDSRRASLTDGQLDGQSHPASSRRSTARAASDSMPQLMQNIRPPRSQHFNNISNDETQASGVSRQPSSTPANRRPVSDYVGRLTGSLRRPKSSRSSVNLQNAPPVPPIPPQHHVSEPSTPSDPDRATFIRRSPALPSIDTNSTLERPLPPPPRGRFNAPDQSPDSASSSISMPSAEQLANLNNRVRKPPSRQAVAAAARKQFNEPNLSPGSITPAPPRGALGAAGNARSALEFKPFQSEMDGPLIPKNQYRSLSTLHNPSSRSSPALLRPTPKRLDTIDSVSSFISRPNTRSRSRDLTLSTSVVPSDENVNASPVSTDAVRTPPGDVTSTNSAWNEPPISRRRSQSAGPALKLDRMPLSEQKTRDRSGKRGFSMGARTPKRGRGRETPNGGNDALADDKGGKCLVM